MVGIRDYTLPKKGVRMKVHKTSIFGELNTPSQRMYDNMPEAVKLLTMRQIIESNNGMFGSITNGSYNWKQIMSNHNRNNKITERNNVKSQRK